MSHCQTGREQYIPGADRVDLRHGGGYCFVAMASEDSFQTVAPAQSNRSRTLFAIASSDSRLGILCEVRSAAAA
jgi:hypothetical protein